MASKKHKEVKSQEGKRVGVIVVGKPKDPTLSECYNPLGYKRLTTQCKLQTGVYYMGPHEGQTFAWVETNGGHGIRRVFKGEAFFKINSKVGLIIAYRAARSTGVTILDSEWVSL